MPTGDETNTAENQLGNNTIGLTDIQIVCFYLGILSDQARSETTFIIPTTTSAAKGHTLVCEIQVNGEINMSQEGEEPHSDGKESFKELKDKS